MLLELIMPHPTENLWKTKKEDIRMILPYRKLKARREFWKRVADYEGSKEDGFEITERVLKTYLRSKDCQMENRKLRNRAKKRASIISMLGNAVKKEEKRCVELIRAKENLEKSKKEMESKYHALQKEFYTLREEYDELLDNPKVKEKIIYKTDPVALDAMRRKRVQLQETLKLVRKERDGLLRKVTGMEKERKSIKQWRKEKYALLVTELYKFSGFTEASLISKNIQILDSRGYYQWKGNREDFERERDVKKPYVVIPIEY